jgi:hypothetical protein
MRICAVCFIKQEACMIFGKSRLELKVGIFVFGLCILMIFVVSIGDKAS